MEMMKKIATGFAITGLFLATLTPAFASTTISITDNGDESSNHVSVKNNCKTIVVQNNRVDSTINLNVVGNTGGNEIEGNTGSGSTLSTGAVTNDVTVSVTGGNNSASVPTCCCGNVEGGNSTSVTLSGNGEETHNTAKVKNKSKIVLKQKNKVKSTVNGNITGNSGGNDVESNTGGNHSLTTDTVDNTVGVTVGGGSNTL